MLVAIGLLVLAGDSIGRLIGDNVCRNEQRSTVNVTEYFLRNVTVRNYEWCLNVPPRCSFYTTRVVNESRIVEKEVINFIDNCCEGFTEDSTTNRCIRFCPGCDKGKCIEGKCSCFSGYKGFNCTSRCDPTEWGENCKFQCSCGGNECHPENGQCSCPFGYTGLECQFPCSPGFHGQNCRLPCNCSSGLCDPITGNCQLASTSDPPTKIRFTNNGKLEIFTTTKTPEFTTDEEKTADTPAQMTEYQQETKKKEVMILEDPKDENKSDLVNSASAATAISAGIIIVAAVIVAANHFKRRRGEDGRKRSKGVSTVAVYTHSIFHTPLPDPPPFDNPIFASPVDPNTNDGHFETHVVCSMNFSGHSINQDARDYMYDHPPSSGSYRAASMPEPPNIEAAPHHSEPLYDEIPSGMVPNTIPASLYMNTCGKTQF